MISVVELVALFEAVVEVWAEMLVIWERMSPAPREAGKLFGLMA